PSVRCADLNLWREIGMAGSGARHRYGQVGRLVQAWGAASAAALLLGAGAAPMARAGVAVAGRGGAAGGGARESHPATLGQECFFTFPACTSADPTVTFVMASNNDTTGCVFKQDTAWGDGSADSVLTYSGGMSGTSLVTFRHTYAAPGTFQISYTIDVTV